MKLTVELVWEIHSRISYEISWVLGSGGFNWFGGCGLNVLIINVHSFSVAPVVPVATMSVSELQQLWHLLQRRLFNPGRKVALIG